MSSVSGNRWWEFYVVRYAMGTVVGALAVYFMIRDDSKLCGALLGATNAVCSGGPVVLSFELLTVFAAFGLSYCYIASAPILVFHVGRFLMSHDYESPPKPRVFIALLATFCTALLGASYLLTPSRLVGDARHNFVASLVCLSILVGTQLAFVISSRIFSDSLYEFYAGLAKARASARKSDNDIVESYRHMREHGNSFLIVLCEILLGLILTGVGSAWNTGSDATGHILVYTALLITWIVPACIVWLIGLCLEHQFWLYNR